MKEESYDNIRESNDVNDFDFISVGTKGNIHKRIRFCQTPIDNVVELMFGDAIGSHDVNYYSVTNNGDRDKILLTVARATRIFLEVNPEKTAYFVGSTHARTRLYKIAISLNLDLLLKDYEIFGFYENQWLPFKKNLNPSAFYVKKRT
jgi:hypothetical protein